MSILRKNGLNDVEQERARSNGVLLDEVRKDCGQRVRLPGP